jgi:sugar/nucleoside kinase (ribokinase family)
MTRTERPVTIFVLGDANADLSAAVCRFPHEGDDIPVAALDWGSGGAGANVAAALALLGSPVRLLARVGNDPAAEVALRVARAAGVDLGLVQRDELVATGLCFAAISPGGERTFLSFRGANACFDLAALGPAPLEGARWLHIAGHALLEGPQRAAAYALAEDAARRGIPASLDLCLPLVRAWRADVLASLPRFQVLFANEPELAALLPGMAVEARLAWLLDHDARLVALKRGARGCIIATPGWRLARPAFSVAAIDSNGCGDAFVAGFIHAYTRGLSLEDCATLGNAMGALTTTHRGSAEALPGMAELRDFLAGHAGRAVVERLLGDAERSNV